MTARRVPPPLPIRRCRSIASKSSSCDSRLSSESGAPISMSLTGALARSVRVEEAGRSVSCIGREASSGAMASSGGGVLARVSARRADLFKGDGAPPNDGDGALTGSERRGGAIAGRGRSTGWDGTAAGIGDGVGAGAGTATGVGTLLDPAGLSSGGGATTVH